MPTLAGMVVTLLTCSGGFAESSSTHPLANVEFKSGSYVMFSIEDDSTKFQQTVSRNFDPEMVKGFFDFLKRSPVGKARYIPFAEQRTNIIILSPQGVPIVCVRYFNFTIPNAAFPLKVDLVGSKIKVGNGLDGNNLYLVHTNGPEFDVNRLFREATPIVNDKTKVLISPRLQK